MSLFGGGEEGTSFAESLSASWLTDALRSGGVLADDAEVTGFEVEIIGVGAGLMGELGRLTLQYSGALGPKTVIVKGPTLDPFMRGVALGMGLYRREVGFYRDVAASLPVNTPTVHWSEGVSDDGGFALVMEDLANCSFGNRGTGIGPERAGTVIEALGALHRTWWEKPQLDKLEWLPTLEDSLANLIGGYQGMLGSFLAQYGDQLPNGSAVAAEKIGPHLGDLMSEGSSAPATLLHGDPRAENFGFEPDGSLCIIDWQTCIRARGVYDLVYFFGQSLSTDDRRQHYDDLVARWHAALGSAAAGYTLDQAREDLRRLAPVGVLQPVLQAAITQMDEVAKGEMVAVLDHVFDLVLDLESTRGL